MKITIDLDVAKETSYLAATVYSVLCDLTKGGTPIEGFSYINTTCSKLAEIVGTHSSAQIKRAVVMLEEHDLIRRIKLTGNNWGSLYGTRI